MIESKPVSVVVLPLPAQGHLNQLLHLARHLAAHDVQVHYIASAAHIRQALDRASDAVIGTTTTNNLQFHGIHLPPYSSPPPNPNSPIKFPTHLQPTFNACLHHLTAPLSSLLLSLSSASRRVTLIHDSTMSSVTAIAASFSNVETYAFHPVSAYTNLFFHLQHSGHHQDVDDALTFKDCFSEEFVEFLRSQHKMTVKDHGRILNTCRAIEGEFIDRIMQEPSWRGQKVFALGPLNQITVDKDRRHKCLDWLSRRAEKSVVYVSFGTTTSLSKEQIGELAKGLEDSKQRFIWVVREADRGNIYASATVTGDDEEVDEIGNKGLVVRGWAPQVEILGHVATAGFMSHCGWNSCMESMSMGVPMLTWPVHSDQPRNAVLVTQVLKVGIVVRDWSRRDEVLPAAAIRDSLKRLMVEEEGEKVARRAMEVGEIIRDCGKKKDVLDNFVRYINR